MCNYILHQTDAFLTLNLYLIYQKYIGAGASLWKLPCSPAPELTANCVLHMWLSVQEMSLVSRDLFPEYFHVFIYFHLLIQILIFSVPVLILTTCNSEKFHSMKITVCKCKVRLFFFFFLTLLYFTSAVD